MPLEKPGTGIFLMKERAKVYRQQSNRKQHQLAKRLGNPDKSGEDMKIDDSNVVKRKKLSDGKAQEIQK